MRRDELTERIRSTREEFETLLSQLTQKSQRSDLELRWPVWIGIVCENLPEQRRFYRDVLGLRELKAGADWVWFDFEGRLLELLAKAPVPQYDRRRVSFAFEVDDIRSARSELIGRGVEPLTEIEGGPESLQYWGILQGRRGKPIRARPAIGQAIGRARVPFQLDGAGARIRFARVNRQTS